MNNDTHQTQLTHVVDAERKSPSKIMARFFLNFQNLWLFSKLVNLRTSPMLINLDIGSLGHDCNLLSHTVMYWADDNHKKVCKICTPFVVGNTIHPSLINLIGIYLILDGTSYENCKDSQNSCQRYLVSLILACNYTLRSPSFNGLRDMNTWFMNECKTLIGFVEVIHSQSEH